MGTRGPIPERSDERIRRNAPVIPIEKVQITGEVEIPELGIRDADQLVVDIYQSMIDSAQNRYFEPTDWQYARLALRLLDQELKEKKFSAAKLLAFNQMFSNLLMTEGDRRRVQIEIERQKTETNNVIDATAEFGAWMKSG